MTSFMFEIGNFKIEKKRIRIEKEIEIFLMFSLTFDEMLLMLTHSVLVYVGVFKCPCNVIHTTLSLLYLIIEPYSERYE